MLIKTILILVMVFLFDIEAFPEEQSYPITVPPDSSVVDVYGAKKNYVAVIKSTAGYSIFSNFFPRQGPYKWIGSDNLRLSPDGEKLAFSYDDFSGASFINVSGKVYGPLTGYIWNGTFSPSGDEFAFVRTTDSKNYLHVGSSVFGPYLEIGYVSYLQGVGFIVQAKNEKGWYSFEGSRMWGPFSEMGEYWVLSDGKTLVYSAKRIDDTKSPTPVWNLYTSSGRSIAGPYLEIEQLTISPDGKNYAFMFKSDDGWRIRSQSVTVGPFHNIFGRFAIANNGTLAYIVEGKNGRRTLYRNDTATGIWGDLFDPSISSNGNLIAVYVFRDGRKCDLITQFGKEEGCLWPYENVLDAHISVDGTHLLMAVKNKDKIQIIVNNSLLMDVSDSLKGTGFRPEDIDLYPSPRWGRLAFIVKDPSFVRSNGDDGYCLLFDGAMWVGQFERIMNLNFAPDSSSLSYSVSERGVMGARENHLSRIDSTHKRWYTGRSYSSGSAYFDGTGSIIVRYVDSIAPSIGVATETSGSLSLKLASPGTLIVGNVTMTVSAGTVPVNDLPAGPHCVTVRYEDGKVESYVGMVSAGEATALSFTYIPMPKATRSLDKSKSLRGEIFVQGGTFRMGSESGRPNEKPVHSVTVSSFWMMKTEVTQKDFIALMRMNPSSFEGDDLPVEKISWYDAIDYANRLSQKDGLTPAYTISEDKVSWNKGADGWRLPTEAEWEFAARGGVSSRGYTYAGGNEVDAVARYNKKGGHGTKPVGTYGPNELGLYDMSGNVSEWCWDWGWSYSDAAQIDPVGAASGDVRVTRGGGWKQDAIGVRVAFRGQRAPFGSGEDLGFRLVRPQIR